MALDGKSLAAGEKPADYATDEETCAYWLGFCKDAVGRAAARKELQWQSRRLAR